MARRRSSRRSSRRSFGRGVSQSSLLNGAMGGAAANIAARYIGPQYGPAAGLAAVGIFRKDNTLQTLAGVSIGSALVSGLQLPGATGSMGSAGVL